MNTKVTDEAILHAKIAKFFLEKMNYRVPSIDADLVQTKILDSLGMVDLLVYLEQEFGIEVPLDYLEIDNFRSIARIAQVVADETVVGA